MTARPIGRYDIICPNANCGYRGKARKEARYSGGALLAIAVISLILLVVALPLGVLFAVVVGGGYILATAVGVNLACPKCRTVVRKQF